MNVDLSTLFIVSGFSLAVAWDLTTRRIPNALNVSLVLISLTLALLISQQSLISLVLSVGAACTIGSLLFLLKVLGGGDVKLMLALSPLLPLQHLLGTYFYAFLWGAAMALITAILNGSLQQLLSRTLVLATHGKDPGVRSQVVGQGLKLPFSIALYLGYLAQHILPIHRIW